MNTSIDLALANASFELGESHGENVGYSWRLKEGELRYRGRGCFQDLIVGRIPVNGERLASFGAALNLLDVWNWLENYRPVFHGEASYSQDDIYWELSGSHWWFKAQIADQQCQTRGCSAYPAYDDPQHSTIKPERFHLLRAALYDAFGIEAHIAHARRQAEHAARMEAERKAD